jgi:hypothetical protein
MIHPQAAPDVDATNWKWNDDEMAFKPDRPQQETIVEAPRGPSQHEVQLKAQVEDAVQQRDQALAMLRSKAQDLLTLQLDNEQQKMARENHLTVPRRNQRRSVSTSNRSSAISTEMGSMLPPDSAEVLILERQLDFHRRQQAELQHEVNDQARQAAAFKQQLIEQKRTAAQNVQQVYRQAEMGMPVTAAEAYSILSSHQNETQTYLSSANTMRAALKRIATEVPGQTGAYAVEVLKVGTWLCFLAFHPHPLCCHNVGN